MCDVAKLKGKMVEKGINQAMLSQKVGIDRSTLSRKLKTGETFTIGEANKIAKALHLTSEEALSIFFSHTVA